MYSNNFDDTLMIQVLAILLSNNVCTVVIKSSISSRKEKVKMQENKGIIAQLSPLLILHIRRINLRRNNKTIIHKILFKLLD